ncbi:uncharacterized protein PAC_17525 [Phialocephala subalpina]|uniref:Uncharacterized protein n=1 Tax=Phialocephala subalpina TaxID=576137 RepID=A0A1L7XRF2_9HELO|nr:uncharacterized protein PAC_17525 [Phialocephala subalpina]
MATTNSRSWNPFKRKAPNLPNFGAASMSSPVPEHIRPPSPLYAFPPSSQICEIAHGGFHSVPPPATQIHSYCLPPLIPPGPELGDYQAEVFMRESPPVVRARTPPRRFRGETVTAEERERRREENFGWVGSYATASVPSEPTDAQAVVSPRNDGPLVTAKTPQMNHGEVVLADDRERRREENLGCVGASAYTVANVPSRTAQAKPSPVRTSPSVRFDTSAVEQVVRTAQTRTPPLPEPLNTSAEDTKGPGVEEDFDSIRPSVPPSQTNRETPYQSLPAMTMANDTEFYHDFLRNEETAAPIITFSVMALQQHDTGFVPPKIDISRDIADENFGNSRSAVLSTPILKNPRS